MAGLFGEDWTPAIHFFDPLKYSYGALDFGAVRPQEAPQGDLGSYQGQSMPMPSYTPPGAPESTFSMATGLLQKVPGVIDKAKGLYQKASDIISGDTLTPLADSLPWGSVAAGGYKDPSSMGGVADDIVYSTGGLPQDPSSMGAVGDEIAAQQAGLTGSQLIGLGGMGLAGYDMLKHGGSATNTGGLVAGGLMALGAPGLAAAPIAMLPAIGDFLKGKPNSEMNYRTWDNKQGPYHIDEAGNKYFLPDIQGLRGDPMLATVRFNPATNQWEQPIVENQWGGRPAFNDTHGAQVTGWQPMKLMRGPDGEPYFHPGGEYDDAYSLTSFNQHLNYDPVSNDNYWTLLNK